MPVAVIHCPNCRRKFTLKAPNFQVMADKRFNCKCGYSTTFGKLLPGKTGPAVVSPAYRPAPQTPPPRPAAPMHTHIAGGPAPAVPGGKTNIAPAVNSAVVTFVVAESGKRFNLSEGVYTLGRQSADSRATLQIAPDKYMGRLQATVETFRNAEGIQCRIIGHSATNPVFVNSRKLRENEAVSLKNGDNLLLGMTHVLVIMNQK